MLIYINIYIYVSIFIYRYYIPYWLFPIGYSQWAIAFVSRIPVASGQLTCGTWSAWKRPSSALKVQMALVQETNAHRLHQQRHARSDFGPMSDQSLLLFSMHF